MFGELKKRIQHGYSHLPRRLFRGAPRGNGRTQTGASLIEFMVALPAFLALGLGTFQTIMVYNAKTVLDYATFEAARTGAVTHAQSHKMRDTLGMRLAPIYGGDGTPEKAMAAITQGILEARDTGYTTIEVLNPTREAFDDFGQTNPETGRIEIPNSHLRYAPRDIGATSGVNLQDANLLKIKVTYGYKLDVPFIDRLVTGTLQRLDPQNAAYYRIGRIPLTAVATVRMQSEAWPGGNVSVASAGGGGAVGDPGNDSGTGGGATGNPGDGTGSNGGQGTGSNDGGNPSGGNTGGNPTGGTGPGGTTPQPDPTQPLVCESTVTPDQDKEGAKDEDQGFWGNLWDSVKDALVEGYEFVKGFWAGIKDQLSDLKDLILHPIDTAKGLIELGKAFYNDPAGTAQMIGEALGQDWSKLVDCGAYDRGRVVGNYVSPAFMLKLATKLSKFSDLSEALNRTKRDFGCASFAAGTPVWTPDGATPIERLRKGMPVDSRDEHSFVDQPQAIRLTFDRTANNLYQLVTEYETLHITGEHPVWVQGKGWTLTAMIKSGDVLATQEGDVVVLHNLEAEAPAEVFNFSVANTENYFVGQSRLWVHNAACDITRPDFKPGELDNAVIKNDYPTAVIGLLGEGKTNKILEDKGFQKMGDTNVDPKKLDNENGWAQEMAAFNGSSGIDSIYKDPNTGKIYIVESKATGVGEGCKAGNLCTTADGKQMSRDWINEDRLRNAGLSDAEIDEVLDGLDDGTTVRLYSGTNKNGETRLFEIKDHPSGDTSNVSVDRAGNEYDFGISNASQAVPAGANLIGAGDSLSNAANWIKPQAGAFDVLVHGSKDAFHVQHNGKWVEINQRSLATFMNKNGYKGEDVRLLSCSTGACTTGVAQDLANKLGANVIAPSDTLWIHPNGDLTIGSNATTNTGVWNTFAPGNK